MMARQTQVTRVYNYGDDGDCKKPPNPRCSSSICNRSEAWIAIHGNEGSDCVSCVYNDTRDSRIASARDRHGLVEPIWIVVTGTSRHYGGPEEGGWWYDWLSIVEVRRVYGWKTALAAVRELREEYPPSRYGRGSAAAGGSMDYAIELHADTRTFPEETTGRPHYE